MNEIILTIMVFIWIAVTLVMAFFQIKFNYRLMEAKKMGLRMGLSKKKKPEEPAEAEVEEPEADEALPALPAPPAPTPEQQAKMDEMKKHIDYFNDTYSALKMGDSVGEFKQMLFAVFCELRNIQELG